MCSGSRGKYDALSLVTAHRTGGGQRRYDRDVLRRLAFIAAARHVGLSLQEIREALPPGAYADDGQSAVPEMLGQILPVGVAGLLLAAERISERMGWSGQTPGPGGA